MGEGDKRLSREKRLGEILGLTKPTRVSLAFISLIDSEKEKAMNLLKYKGKVQSLAKKIYASLEELIKKDSEIEISEKLKKYILDNLTRVLFYVLDDFINGKKINEGEITDTLTKILILPILFNLKEIEIDEQKDEIENRVKKVIQDFFENERYEENLEHIVFSYSKTSYMRYLESYLPLDGGGIYFIINAITTLLQNFIIEIRNLDKGNSNYEENKNNLIEGAFKGYFRIIDFKNFPTHSIKEDNGEVVDGKEKLKKEIEESIREFIEEQI